jgi:hypothetical protein
LKMPSGSPDCNAILLKCRENTSNTLFASRSVLLVVSPFYRVGAGK